MLNDRFWNKVDKSSSSGCWEWTANKNNKGYGQFRPGGLKPKRLAHRILYEDIHGRIPAGMEIMHSCDNPSCVNPDHLSAGTHQRNMTDKLKKGRHKSGSMKGQNNPSAKLTEQEVIRLLKDYVEGVPRKDICLRYGLSEASLSSYTDGKAWVYLHGTFGCPTLDDLKAAKRRKPGAKVTAQIASEIRSRLSAGETGRSLAAEFGIHFATVSDIKLRKIWADE